MSIVLLATREEIWGGGESFLLSVADYLMKHGHTPLLAAPPNSEIRRRADPRLQCYDLGEKTQADIYVFNDFHSERRHRRSRTHADSIRVVHGWWQASRARNAYSRASGTRLVAISTPVRRAIHSAGFYKEAEIPVLPVGPDHALFRRPSTAERTYARQLLKLGAREIGVVFVGRPQNIKRPELFVDLVTAANAVPVIVVSEASSAAEKGVLRRLQAAIDRAPRAIRLGSDMVRAALWACDIMVNTSEFESLGIAMMEAMACGLPVITTAVGGPGDFIETGLSGYLVRSECEALERLNGLIADDTIRRAMGDAAIAAVATRTIDRVVAGLLA